MMMHEASTSAPLLREEGPDREIGAGKAICVVDKIDLLRPNPSLFGRDALFISARTGEGLNALKTALVRFAEQTYGGGETPLITRARHRQEIERARCALQQFLDGVDAGEQPEVAAEHLREAAAALGRLTGRLDVEDVLGQILRVLRREIEPSPLTRRPARPAATLSREGRGLFCRSLSPGGRGTG